MNKVLIVATSYPYPEYRDGLAKINANLLKKNDYFNADMLCIGDVGDTNTVETGKIFKILPRKKKHKFSQIFSFIFSLKPVNVSKYSEYIRQYKDFLLEHHTRYSAIHLSSPYLAEIAIDMPSEIVNKMIIFPIDCMALFWYRRKKNEENIFRRMAYSIEFLKCSSFEKKYYNLFKAAVFVSDVDRDYATKITKENNYYTIPNGVDIDYFKSDDLNRGDKNFLVFTGDMSYSPNKDAVNFLVNKVFPKISQKFQPHLLLVGQKPDETTLSFASEHITVTGFVDDLRPYLNRSKVYISPLRFGSGIKNKILEAMSMGMVVIGTKVSFEGIECTPGHDCVLVEVDETQMAKAVEEIFQNQMAYASMRENARDLAEKKYSWDSIRKAYGLIYENRFSN
ncbi:glycosyltransferase [Janthinobacterium sp. PLB04]|uniref:Glycosyltransferase n=1 Tax=Janthinobacterium lividum TaxID=29581 RepID=A0AAJ4MSD5_9BURK|nr:MULTISPECIES: glycosyltransferase [Janthinobacterium]KAB0327130.1 glycosyltransferase [Janthinobacterium lividum]QSX96270.1 glycosyltransferase [Janthinobacterium lividum]UGQ36142.1 glycosyltransferase [Janthinobacterium sp. PLB04]